MEKEEQRWEQEEVEQEQEEEETSLQVRKSRPVDETKSTESAIVETEKSNGTSESNGHEIQSTVTANGSYGTKDLESTLENGEEKDELDGVVGNEEEISNGLQESDNLVFFDEDEGNEFTPISGDQQIEKRNGHKELDISSQEFDALHNSTKGGSEGHLSDDSLSYSYHQQIEIQEDDGLSNSDLKSSGEIESEEVYVVPGDELEVTEIDVERVLQKQTTHDLYCPNCNSCITRRVILRKRKRRIRLSAHDIKRNKLEAVADSKLDADSFQVSSTVVHERDYVGVDSTPLLASNDADHDGEPDLFRCLSCFSFFFPTGKKVKVIIQDEQAPSTKNWWTSMFAFNKQETAVARENKSREDERKSDMGLVPSSDIIDPKGQPSFVQESHPPAQASDIPVPRQGHAVKTKVLVGAVADKTTERIEATIEHFEAYTSDQLQESKSGKELQTNHGTNLSTKSPPKGPHFTNEESYKDDISSSKGGMNLLISSDEEFMTFEKPKEGQIPYQKIQISKAADDEAIQIMATPVSIHKDVHGRMGISLAVPHEDQHFEATIVTESVVENKKAKFQSGDDGQVYPTEVSQHIVTKTKFEVHAGESLKIDDIPSVTGASIVQGKDTVITIDARTVGSSQTGQNNVYPEETSGLHSAPQVTADAEGTEVRNEFEIEVVKSIVYGGLAESITSLSVVSAAAGGGAATLKILALGMANLIGGLFVIFHNLWELRSECIEQTFNNHGSPGIEQKDRYKELLGRKENFALHAIVSILSYVIFGLVAPVTYGFSFRKSDNKEFKLIVVAASSLLCISGLAVGRAYVKRRPRPYVKSVVTYLIMGFMVSGVSYVAGVLVERILEKLGLFHSSSGANLFLPQMETVPSYSGWTSY
ncbi:membrane protein of ER body-like protein isoform X2 [Henckelia pumila]|uniref:membrane protein of ER body-like protein isoform X2 n=1 Tax=Henckelia pumila TaxID=405737 RepID=UPI003C6E1242